MLQRIQSNLHVRPPPISDRQSNQKHQNFPSQSALQLKPPVNDHLLIATVTTFWAWKFNDFPLFLTSSKRPLDAFSNLHVRCVRHAT